MHTLLQAIGNGVIEDLMVLLKPDLLRQDGAQLLLFLGGEYLLACFGQTHCLQRLLVRRGIHHAVTFLHGYRFLKDWLLGD